jgi:DNA-binding NtrC family response regulator
MRKVMNRRLLLIDDEPAILISFKKLLQSPGITVDTAEDIECARELIEEQFYDGVVADLRLSGISGEEGLEIIRLVKERHPETQVILMTAYGNHDVMKRAYRLGAAVYLEKPVSTSVIKYALRSLGVVPDTVWL